MQTPGPKTIGAKAILYLDRAILTILRDDDRRLPFPNHWDLPGGDVDPGETAIAAVVREIQEELGLRDRAGDFIWDRVYSGRTGQFSHFFAAPVSEIQVDAITFGDEGQTWRLMDQTDFVTRTDTVPHFRSRVTDFFATRPNAGPDAERRPPGPTGPASPGSGSA